MKTGVSSYRGKSFASMKLATVAKQIVDALPQCMLTVQELYASLDFRGPSNRHTWLFQTGKVKETNTARQEGKEPMRTYPPLIPLFAFLFLLFVPPRARGAQYVVAWGVDDGDRINVPAGLTNAEAVGATDVSLALRQNGSALGWGSSSSQASVPPGITDLRAIALGEYHALGLKTDGTVVAWGDDIWGQTDVPLGLTDVAAVSAGWGHSLALSSNGTVVAWGWADSGRTTVPPGLSNVVAISAGGGHNLALKSNGNVVAWGANFSGQTDVPAGLSNILSVAAGGSHSVAIKADLSLAAWGDNSYGKTNIPVGLSNVVAIAAGENFNLALKSDGTVAAWGWGNNSSGTAEVPPGLSNVIAVAAGRLYSLAVAVVNNGAPIVTRHPSIRGIYSGMPVSFVVAGEGVPAPACQWQLNGTNIAGATNFSLQLTNVPTPLAGVYRAVLSNSQGTSYSLGAELKVTDSRPYVSIEPQDQIAYQGTVCSLTASAIGSWPLQYQWYFNGSRIAGATQSSLVLNPAQKTNTGTYNLVITNWVGSVTSAPALVTVYDLADALNTNLVWTTFGDALWFGENQVQGYFTPAASSGAIANNQSSKIQTTVAGPGTLTFQWKVSSEATADYLSFSINGAEQKRISGDDWRSETFYLGAGNNVLQWTYAKDSSGSAGQDAAWLDWVTYTNGVTLPTITVQPLNQALTIGSNFTFSVSAYGTPPLNYQWQFSGDDIAGATGTSLTLTNVQLANQGRYRVIISNPYGSTTSSGAALFTFVGPDRPQDALDRWYLRSTAQLTRLRFVGDLFIGLGPSGTLITSPDGTVWTSRNSGTIWNLSGVAFGTVLSPLPHGLFVAVGPEGTILTSADGSTWNPVAATSQDVNDVSWQANRFVATATARSTGEPNVFYSADGTNWTGAKFFLNPDTGLPMFSSSTGVSGGYFVTAAGSQFAYYIWRSANGSNWQNVGFSDQVVAGIASGNGSTIIVGWEGWPRVSTNQGASWFASASSVITSNAYQPPPYYSLPMAGSDIAFGNGTFLVARSFLRNGFLTTSDGLTWSKRDLFSGAGIESVAFGKGTFVAACSGGSYPMGIYQSETVTLPIIGLQLQTSPKSILLTISGEQGRAYRLQTSANLHSWADYRTYTNTMSATQFQEPVSETPLFYKVTSP